MPVIGFLHSGSPTAYADLVAAFRKGLSEAGYVERQNVAIEYRWGEGHNERLPALAAELVIRQVDVIVTPGSTPAALAAKAATTTIPIIFTSAADPVKIGLVASLNRPGGNLTGVTVITAALWPKRLELLRELISPTPLIALLINPNNLTATHARRELNAAARRIGQDVLLLDASAEVVVPRLLAMLAVGLWSGLRGGAARWLAPAVSFNMRPRLFVNRRLCLMPQVFSANPNGG